MTQQQHPALLQLDQDIHAYLTDLLEPGTQQDYVTLEYILQTYPATPQHHINQITTRIKSYLETHGKHTYNVILAEKPLEEECCMSCGKQTNIGYSYAYQFLKLRSGKRCPYNYQCECIL